EIPNVSFYALQKDRTGNYIRIDPFNDPILYPIGLVPSKEVSITIKADPNKIPGAFKIVTSVSPGNTGESIFIDTTLREVPPAPNLKVDSQGYYLVGSAKDLTEALVHKVA